MTATSGDHVWAKARPPQLLTTLAQARENENEGFTFRCRFLQLRRPLTSIQIPFEAGSFGSVSSHSGHFLAGVQEQKMIP
ncbi:unnamed protein product [Prunus armeniaca]